MNNAHLIDGHLPQSAAQKIKKAQIRRYIRDAAMLSIGLAISYALIAQPQNSAQDAVSNTQSLWVNEPKNTFGWNEATALEWVPFSKIVDISASPSGELYGITEYSVGPNKYRQAYKFNLDNGEWTSFDNDFQIKDIKFDNLGNYYLLDTKNRLYAKNSKTSILLNDIKDFEVSSNGQIYAISQTIQQSNKETKLNTLIIVKAQWNQPLSYQYILYSSKTSTLIAMKDDVPIFVDENSTTVGYGNQCIKDLTVGADGSLWALSCIQNSEKTDFQLIKWEPVRGKWYDVNNSFGVKIAAFNEISISIVDSKGRIRNTIDKNRYENVRFTENGFRPQLLADSMILNSTNIQYVQGLINKMHSISKICYRATVDGFSASSFHQGCDYQGPTITILKSQNGRVAGAYTSASFTSIGITAMDEKAFIFSPDLQVVLPIKEQKEAHYDQQSYGPNFGINGDLFVCSNSNEREDSYSYLGKSYQLPAGITYGSNEARTYLFGQVNFYLAEIEVYSLI
ncbi:UNKNOWN [Stylonychia lemnae]|uniref:TLDc domain-containing protein n=1 Tax=Stylonychia lemnae TaxID=5949 RepID=A0A078AWE8_STYLE|nr:UNKNOWN [Stylonychia lemnae]|eukprot:CDW86474.1 UNKNOWN [Stylonychia lemnae]